MDFNSSELYKKDYNLFKNTAKALDANESGREFVFKVNICFREIVLLVLIAVVYVDKNY